MKSMTGYGNSQFSNKELHLEISVRAVNGRFLETRVHLPREYLPFENEIKNSASQLFARGTVDIFINRRWQEDSQNSEVKVNKSLAKKWTQAYGQLGKDLKVSGELSLMALAALPQVLVLQESSGLAKGEKTHLLQTAQKALKLCVQERIREGLALKKDLQKLVRDLKVLVQKMEKAAGRRKEDQKLRLEQRLQMVGLESKVDPQRFEQELAFQLDKSDIAEELTRLNEHLKYFSGFMEQKAEPQGKKLDFYTQELLREINTIGSKSQLAELTQMVVNAKALVEKIKEQVQNIE